MIDIVKQIPDQLVFREPNNLAEGVFMLTKSYFLAEGVNFPFSGRCDDLTYTGVMPTYGTPYVKESVVVGNKDRSFAVADPSAESVSTWIHILEVPGKFLITYASRMKKDPITGQPVPDLSAELGLNPGSLWLGKSLIELLKIAREWASMADEPFNLEHPMAVYSKMLFDVLEAPQSILDEIDSLPDMHLARFLKGDDAHRERLSYFPQMSDEMIDWFKQKMLEYPPTTTRDKLRAIEL